MHIGIDARLYGIAGPGRYISNLIEQLEKLDKSNEYIIFVTKAGNDLYHPKNPNFKKWVADYPLYSIQEQTNFLIDLFRAKLDLLHVPHFNIPVLYHRKFIVTIHDLIMDDTDSKEATTKSPYVFMTKKFFYKIVMRFAAAKSKKILVPSETVKKEILDSMESLDESKIVVTYEGVAENLIKSAPSDKNVLSTRLEQMKIKDRYFLYVGSAYPHKNLETLVISFKEFLQENPELSFQLVIAGRIDDFSQRLAG